MLSSIPHRGVSAQTQCHQASFWKVSAHDLDHTEIYTKVSDIGKINLIRQALDNQEWVVARAADKLGMRRTTLVEKMRKYDIQRTEDA